MFRKSEDFLYRFIKNFSGWFQSAFIYCRRDQLNGRNGRVNSGKVLPILADDAGCIGAEVFMSFTAV
jgi:hypothetical protein